MHSTSLRLINKHSNNHDDALHSSRTKVASVHKAYSDSSNNPAFIQYNLFNEKRLESKRWLANVSGYKLVKQSHVHAINVQPTANKDDFEIIRTLLIAKTCHTIMFDKQFSVSQTKELKELARFSGTQLAFIKDRSEYVAYTERRFAH
jgi:hypothetical protein